MRSIAKLACASLLVLSVIHYADVGVVRQTVAFRRPDVEGVSAVTIVPLTAQWRTLTYDGDDATDVLCDPVYDDSGWEFVGSDAGVNSEHRSAHALPCTTKLT